MRKVYETSRKIFHFDLALFQITHDLDKPFKLKGKGLLPIGTHAAKVLVFEDVITLLVHQLLQ